MTRNEVRDILTVAFLATWPSNIPVAFDNAQFAPPPDDTAFAQFAVRFLEGEQSSLGQEGNRRFHRGGIVTILINVPANTAIARGDELAALALNIFDGKEHSGVSFYNGTYREVGPAGKYYTLAATAEFSYTEIK